MATGLFLRRTLKMFLMGALLSTFAGWAASARPLKPTTEALMVKPSVVPIFFVPTDWPVSSSGVQSKAAALRTALAEIQDFYGDKLNFTFRLESLVVVQAYGRKEAYEITWGPGNIYDDGVVAVGSNFEHLVVSELYARGYPTPPAQNEDGRSALIFVKGAGGWAGGREFPSANGGWAILGDWCIDSIAGNVPEGAYWWSGRRLQVGAAAHELGHTFGLPHPDVNRELTIMYNWWDYPTVGFLPSERAHLAGPEKNVFFVARPADFDYENADAASLGVRQIEVVPGGEWLQARYLSGSTWGPWQPTRISAIGIPGLTSIRSFSQGLRPSDGAPKQDFLDATGTLLYSRAFVGGIWQPATVLNVSQLGISGVTSLWGFEQTGGTSGDPFKQVAIPVNGQGLYYRLYGAGAWGAWTFTSTSTLIPGLTTLRSFSEARISSTLLRQDVLGTDNDIVYIRTRGSNGVWSAWLATPVTALEIPVL